MARVRRVDVGGMVYHALNRANFRSRLFRKDMHYQEFLDIREESLSWAAMRILAYCLMPNHGHLVLQPPKKGSGAFSGLPRFSAVLSNPKCLYRNLLHPPSRIKGS